MPPNVVSVAFMSIPRLADEVVAPAMVFLEIRKFFLAVCVTPITARKAAVAEAA